MHFLKQNLGTKALADPISFLGNIKVKYCHSHLAVARSLEARVSKQNKYVML